MTETLARVLVCPWRGHAWRPRVAGGVLCTRCRLWRDTRGMPPSRYTPSSEFRTPSPGKRPSPKNGGAPSPDPLESPTLRLRIATLGLQQEAKSLAEMIDVLARIVGYAETAERLDQVLRIHHNDFDLCAECRQLYPCKTRRTLAGEGAGWDIK